MFSFFKRKKPLLPVPDWASFFTVEEYNQFVAHLDNYFKGRRAENNYNEAAIIAEDESGEKTTHGLNNIAQQCKQTPRRKWKRLIASHFDSFKKVDRFNRKFEARAHDFNHVRQYLGVRLYGQGYINNLDEDIIITRSVMDGTVAMLVFDFPHSVSNVKPQQSVLWNKSEDELFEIGISNIKANYPIKISTHDLDGFDVLIAEGDHFFVPNIIFELKQYPSLAGTYGSLVGIPHRHAALFYPIENMQVAQAANIFIQTVRYMYEQGPGSINSYLYWYYQGSFQLLPYEMDDQTLKLIPPEDFVDMLNLLK